MIHLKSWVAFGVTLSVAAPAGYADEPKTAGEIIVRLIEAIGGQKKIDSIKSARMTGKSVFQGGMEAPLVIESKRPNKVRIEFTLQGMTGTQAFDGHTGWFIMPFMGKTDPEKMPPEMVKLIEDQADIDGPLVGFEAKGHQVELAGKDEIEGSPTYKLTVTKKNGDIEHWYLDTEHYLPLAMKKKISVQGTEVDIEVSFSDYKPIEGYVMAHSIAQKSGMGNNTIVVEKVELNPQLPDERFAMPEVKKPEAPSEEDKTDGEKEEENGDQ